MFNNAVAVNDETLPEADTVLKRSPSAYRIYQNRRCISGPNKDNKEPELLAVH